MIDSKVYFPIYGTILVYSSIYLVYMVITWYKVTRLQKCLLPIKYSWYYTLRTLGQWQGRGENGHLVYSQPLQWRVARRQPCLANTCEGMRGHPSCPCAHLGDIIVATAHLQMCSMSDHSVYTGKCFILAKQTNGK